MISVDVGQFLKFIFASLFQTLLWMEFFLFHFGNMNIKLCFLDMYFVFTFLVVVIIFIIFLLWHQGYFSEYLWTTLYVQWIPLTRSLVSFKSFASFHSQCNPDTFETRQRVGQTVKVWVVVVVLEHFRNITPTAKCILVMSLKFGSVSKHPAQFVALFFQ